MKSLGGGPRRGPLGGVNLTAGSLSKRDLPLQFVTSSTANLVLNDKSALDPAGPVAHWTGAFGACNLAPILAHLAGLVAVCTTLPSGARASRTCVSLDLLEPPVDARWASFGLLR